VSSFHSDIISTFLRSSAAHDQRNAFFINENEHSYNLLRKRIATLYGSISGMKGETVAIVTNDHLDTYAAIWACWLCGKNYVPLNPGSPPDLNNRIKSQVELAGIIDSTETSNWPDASEQQTDVVLENASAFVQDDNSTAYILFTSGSTGVPKGVPITFGNIAAFVDAFYKMGYTVSEQDRVLQMFELTFDLSVMSYLVPQLSGACVYTIPQGRIKFSYIFELLDEYQLTIALMVPSMLNFLRPYFDEIDCPNLRYSLFCGEALHLDILEEWAERVPNARIDNVYGPTENTIFCTYYTYQRDGHNPHHNGILTIGKSMAHSVCTVMNDDDKPAAIEEIGELCLSGGQLTPGYLNNAELNETAFFQFQDGGKNTRYYRSGDLCRLSLDGNLMYAGRKDTQVKIQGFRVELSEVEFQAKKALSDKTNTVAFTHENNQGIHEIFLVIECEEFDQPSLKESLKNSLPAYMLPKNIFTLTEFPLNVNGKIDRKTIKQQFSTHVL
jgi:amino acid adenylation domain-containing protein